MSKKHIVEIKEFTCPFCSHKETVRVSDEIIDEETGKEGFIGIDYWECPKCGEENDIGLECFEKDFKVFQKYTEKNDWNGLLNFCNNNEFEFDDFMLFSLAKYYIQKKDFEKAKNIAKTLVELDPGDVCSKELIEKCDKVLKKHFKK